MKDKAKVASIFLAVGLGYALLGGFNQPTPKPATETRIESIEKTPLAV